MICWICHEQPGVEHEHHPVLQAAGGKDEGTITLCGNCHNSVHNEINRVCAAYRNGKGGFGVNWKTCRHSQEVENATKVILVGVQSVLTFDGAKSTKIGIAVDEEVHQMLVRLKQMTGANSLPTVVIECIKFTAKHAGLV